MSKAIDNSQVSAEDLFWARGTDMLPVTVSPNILARQGDGGLMGRLVCKWDEVTDTGDIQHHIYSAGIDTNNRVYLDCRKRLIFSKILFSTAGRPLHAVVKTLYHLSMIPVVKAIFFVLSRQITAKEAFVKSVQSTADIVRTPLYETAIIIVGIVALLSAPLSALIAPSALYKFREIIGRIEAALFRTRFHESTLTPCFQSIDLQELVEDYGTFRKHGELILRDFNDTDYGIYSIDGLLSKEIIDVAENSSRTLYKIKDLKSLSHKQKAQLRNALAARSIIHYGRAMIKTQRAYYNPFYHVFGKLDPNVTYVSLAYSKIVNEIKKTSIRFADVAIEYVINSQNGGKLEAKEVDFNVDNIRHELKIKEVSNPRSVFIERVQKKANSSDIKRISFLIKSIANAFEIVYNEVNLQKVESASDKSRLKKNSLKNFEKEIDKLLAGVKKTEIKHDKKLLRGDGDALLPVETKYRKRLKKSSMKYAKELFFPIEATPTPEGPAKANAKHKHGHKKTHKTETTAIMTTVVSVTKETTKTEHVKHKHGHKKKHKTKTTVKVT